jgi:hypothetical protein
MASYPLPLSYARNLRTSVIPEGRKGEFKEATGQSLTTDDALRSGIKENSMRLFFDEMKAEVNQKSARRKSQRLQ